jgi:hypothetical protein
MRAHFFATFWFFVFSAACFGDVVGNNPVLISGSGCRFPDAAYSSVDGSYLVVWADYNAATRGVFGRRVNSVGGTVGDVFRISEVAQTEALYPAIAYNATNNEYLVTFDTSTSIYGQRVRASDGALMGGNFAIGAAVGGIRSGVAWSAASNNYLVTYYVAGGAVDVYGRRVSAAGGVLGGEMNISSDANFSGYPAVAYGSSGNQFLVTWDHEPSNNFGYIRGQRIDAATGGSLGGAFNIATGGTENRSTIAYDTVSDRWLVQYNESNTPGFSYDQSGRFVSPSGGVGGAIPIAHTTGFEGDTLLGGDVAFAPGFGGRFFSSFQSEAASVGIGGQETFANGTPVASQVNLGAGPYTSHNNAADTNLNRFLTVWEGLSGGVHYIHGRVFESRPVAAEQIALFTLNNDAQSWTLTPWRSGTNAVGTVGWDGAAGNPAGSFKTTGSGMTNNQDYQTREGAYLTRAISLEGRRLTTVQFDLRTARDGPPGASGTGSGNLLEGSPEDKLVVYYSLSGANGPWQVADVFSENDGELPAAWTHRSLDLSSIAGAINNRNFALRFGWQFNTLVDTGWLDNILVTGSPVMPGDIDLDGDVDRGDAAVFSRHLGTTAGSVWTTGDFDGDQATTLSDLDILQSRMGERAGAAATETRVVPEPSSAALVVLGLLVLAGVVWSMRLILGQRH